METLRPGESADLDRQSLQKSLQAEIAELRQRNSILQDNLAAALCRAKAAEAEVERLKAAASRLCMRHPQVA